MPTSKLMFVDYLIEEHQLSKVKAFRVVGLSRSAYYKPRVDWAQRDAEIVSALNEIVETMTRWGFWKCFNSIRADGKNWNHERVYSVYCAMKLNLKRKTKKRFITREKQAFVFNEDLNKVWALDFMRDSM